MQATPHVIFKIELYTHFFKVVKPAQHFIAILNEFIRPLIQYEVDRVIGYKPQFRPVRTFATKTQNNSEFRFHINQYEKFVEFLNKKGIEVKPENITVMPIPVGAKLSHKYYFEKSLRDYQEKAMDHIFKDIPGQHTRLLGMPTGTGKTFTGLYACSKVGTRVIIFLLPQYIDKWTIDIQQNMNVSSKSIMTVRGSGQLKGLIDLGKNDELEADYILVSIRTMQNFIDQYNNDSKYCIEDYGCSPEDLYSVLHIGQALIDETHQQIHAVFRIMLFMNVGSLLSLSATLISDDVLIKNMHNIMYPKEIRYDELLMKKYISLFPIDYSFKNYTYRKISFREFNSNSYSHLAYEKSILRRSDNTAGYVNMVIFLAKSGYIDRKENSDKLIVFAASIRMCEVLVDNLKLAFPKLDTRKYTQEDKYENILEADIIVSTILSAGTALDIPNLTTVINTVNIMSPVANLQSLGRLREIPNKEMRFYYVYCTDIPKHIVNNARRIELFKDRVISIKQLKYPYQL